MAVRRSGSEADVRSGVRWAAAWIAVLAASKSAFTPATAAAQGAVALAPSDPFYLTQYAYTFYVSQQPLPAAGYSLLAAGRTEQARTYAERAVAIGPGRITTHLRA